jgi:hypothetical protein
MHVMSTSNYPEHDYWMVECHREIRATIGRQLRNQYEIPNELPHQLLTILVQLTEQPARRRAHQKSPLAKPACEREDSRHQDPSVWEGSSFVKGF